MASPRQSLDFLIQQLNNTHNGASVRVGAAEGLGHLGGPDAREVLISAANNLHNAGEIRAAALRALGMACQR
ncbi:HEAT repeat domain-containing protein [Cupriavidus basilensis]|uniref:HEAT repeat domain-containing protein n=1 Tax=Cupriavidus basilensis TaxID=68895 RepID=UPI0039F67BAA